MNQIKGLELISGIELAFGSYLTGAINMKSKEISMQVKEAEKTKWIYQRNSKYFRSGHILSTPRKIEYTDELNKIKMPWIPHKTTKVDDGRILSFVKKNPITRFRKGKNTLEKVAISLSKIYNQKTPQWM